MRFSHQKHIELGEGTDTVLTGVHLAKLGDYAHPVYGDFSITSDTTAQLISNFDNGVYGQKIFADIEHKPSNGAAAEITRIYMEGEWLKGDLELTEYGRDGIQNRKHIYLSIDYADQWQDAATKEIHGAVLFGAGLTTRPFIKGQPGIMLAENTEEKNTMTWLEKLKAKLTEMGASVELAKILSVQFDAEEKKLNNDPARAQLLGAYVATAKGAIKTLNELGEKSVTIQLAAPTAESIVAATEAVPAAAAEPKTLSATDVTKMLDDRDKARTLAATETAKKLSDNQGAYDKVLSEAEGLSDETRKLLSVGRDSINEHFTPEQVQAYAKGQVEIGNKIEANKQLSGMGYHVEGSPTITVGADNSVKKLSVEVRKHLSSTSAAHNGDIKLAEKESPFVSKVLAEFDRLNGRKLSDEARMLSGESTIISDTSLPTSFQREVIRESLSDLNILNIVRTEMDPSATATMDIPYEQRDMSGVVNGGRVYEGQGINGASIAQMMDLAYVFPRKLSLSLSNEVMHFSRASAINWDAWGRNIESNSRIMRELVAADIANEMQRSSDSFGAIDVVAEDIAAQLNGSKATIKTAAFPVVRQHQRYDLQGNTVGAADNPITVMFGATPVLEFNGTGTQSAGTYYVVTNYNLGYIKFVSELGAEVMPSEAAATISYSRATNIVTFDLDTPSGITEGKHLDGLLQAIGARKAAMKSDRYEMPDFQLMSSTLNDTCTNADQHAASMNRNGTSTTSIGDLATVKGIPALGTDQPGIDLGDERILMGRRNTTTYGIAKPYQIGMPFEQVNSLGQAIGKKMAYGEEYATIHTPNPIKNRYTSVIAYSASARSAV